MSLQVRIVQPDARHVDRRRARTTPAAPPVVSRFGVLRRRLRRAFVLLALPLVPLLGLAACPLHYVYFDRSALPDLESFLRFEPPATGRIYDDRGTVLIELARQYRRIVAYEEVPTIVREAILAAEDRNFFSHSGVEYRALPRVVQKTATRSFGAWRNGDGLGLNFAQGGSTITQQLVRNYFLQDMTLHENSDVLVDEGRVASMLAAVLGGRATNKLLRKAEEIRLSLWLEEEMRRRYGSVEQAKREIFTRYTNYIYLGNGRYGFAAASEYYFGVPLSSYTTEDAGRAALLAGIGKSPAEYAPVPGNERPLRRRNAILALMARNGSISETLAKRCQSEPILVAERRAVKTEAPGAIADVLDELKRRGGNRFGIEDLFQGRISIRSTVDGRAQAVASEALEAGLALYEQRHRKSTGVIQGSVVVLRNEDAGILAVVGGRRVFEGRGARYSDLNRVTGSLRQSGSAWKPMVYLAAFRQGLDLDTTVPDEPLEVSNGIGREAKWIGNYDKQFEGLISLRQALAGSRNAAAVWVALAVGVNEVNRTAQQLGISTPLGPYISTALGTSDVRLLELAGIYRAMASGVLAEPYVISRVTDARSGLALYEARPFATPIGPPDGPTSAELSLIQEGLRGVVRLPKGTAHSLDNLDFPIAVMGKTGTTNDFRDALFVGSTYGRQGITVAVRIGFDDNRSLGANETGSRVALPIFREIMMRLYREHLVGPPPLFPSDLEARIDEYLEMAAAQAERDVEFVGPPGWASPRVGIPWGSPNR